MSLAKTFCISLIGLTGTLIEVEADISSNLPGFVLVGLPDASLSEATARVRAATANSKAPLPNRKVTVNLSPASVPKFGSVFDLAIAIAALAAAGKVTDESIAGTVYFGELGLDGSIRPVSGVLPAVMSAKREGFRRVVVPMSNLAEAKLIEGIEAIGASHLTQVLSMHGLEIQVVDSPVRDSSDQQITVPAKIDISEIHGQSVEDLFTTVRCRKIAIALGFEKMTLKDEVLRCFFINRPDAPYFESDTFKNLLAFTQTSMNNAHFKQVGKTFILIIKDVKDMESCLRVLNKMHAGVVVK